MTGSRKIPRAFAYVFHQPPPFQRCPNQLKLWSTARTDEQIVADYHQARNTHAYADLPPEVRLTAVENSVQVYLGPIIRLSHVGRCNDLKRRFRAARHGSKFHQHQHGAESMRFFVCDGSHWISVEKDLREIAALMLALKRVNRSRFQRVA